MYQIVLSVKGRFIRKIRRFRGGFGFLSSYIEQNLDSHYPNSGNWQPSSKQLLRSVNQFHNQIIEILKTQNLFEFIEIFKIDQDNIDKIKYLNKLFNEYGSDKAVNGYSEIYVAILEESRQNLTDNAPISILEVGIGTNNPNVPSNMGARGKPGASLRAFRDFDSKIECIGFDIDSSILFQENRIRTFEVDQQNLKNYLHVMSYYKSNWPILFIDDGLHSPYANINSLLCFIKLSNRNSYLVIEDISKRSEEIWDLINSVISSEEFRVWKYISLLGGTAIVIKNIGEKQIV